MRISDHYRFMLTQQNVNSSTERVMNAQQEVSTGKRVNVGSDDPLAFDRIQDVRQIRDDIEQYQDNIAWEITRMQESDAVLGEMHNVLVRAKELSVAVLSVTMEPEDRAAAAEELRGLRQTYVSLANHKYDGKYIFSGNATDTPPIAADGSYQGQDAAHMVEVGVERKRDLAINGEPIFNDPAGLDIWDTLDRFITALDADDTPTLQVLVDEIEVCREQVSRGRSEVGILHTQLMLDDTLASRVGLDRADEDANLSEIDITNAVSNLMRYEQSFKAALQITQKSLNAPSLLDYLR